jgi:hypothetical protein
VPVATKGVGSRESARLLEECLLALLAMFWCGETSDVPGLPLLERKVISEDKTTRYLESRYLLIASILHTKRVKFLKDNNMGSKLTVNFTRRNLYKSKYLVMDFSACCSRIWWYDQVGQVSERASKRYKRSTKRAGSSP